MNLEGFKTKTQQYYEFKKLLRTRLNNTVQYWGYWDQDWLGLSKVCRDQDFFKSLAIHRYDVMLAVLFTFVEVLKVQSQGLAYMFLA